MKLFVVVVSVAVVIMFVFATNTAAAPTDYQDTNDMISHSAAVGGNSPYAYISSSDSGSSSKSSKKHPILEIIKSVIKLLTKMFSYSDTTIPINQGVRQHHRGMLA